jgi:hypothetical protein
MTAHIEVPELLEADIQLHEWGIDTVLNRAEHFFVESVAGVVQAP